MPRRGLSFEEALALARAHALALPAEPVPVAEAAGRVLAADVRSRIDHPAFTNAAMDGYAVRGADTPGRLRLVGESRAGAPFAGRLGAGEATTISTGAVLSPGADAVLRREDAEELDGTVLARVGVDPGRFVRARGEDLAEDAVLLPAGAVVGPHEVTAIAAAGHAEVLCARRPRVAVLGSGDELVPPGAPLAPGQVYDANRLGLGAQVRAAGGAPVASVLTPDDRGATIAAVRDLLDAPDGPPPDVLITIGGVSVGPHDHLRPAFAAVGVEEVFAGVEMRPGHPVVLGVRGPQRVLGLPGNPVSAAVCFHLFGRPLLGHHESWERRAPLAADYRKDTPRADFIRCAWHGHALLPLPRQASHAITSLAGAGAIAWIPPEQETTPAGAEVRYSPLGP